LKLYQIPIYDSSSSC